MKFLLTIYVLLSITLTTFGQKISIIPNWNIGDKRNLDITTTLPREEEESIEETVEEIDESEELQTKPVKEILIDTLYFKATMEVIDKTKQGYTIRFAYTDFHVDSSNMDEYTLQSMNIYNTLGKVGAVVYETDENGKFLEYVEVDALERVGKSIGSYLGFDYEISENYYDDVEEIEVDTDEDWESTFDVMTDSTSIESEDVDLEDAFSGNMTNWINNLMITECLETSFTERLTKIHDIFGETYDIGVEKAVDNLSLLKIEELKDLSSGMFDITGKEILTDETTCFHYKVDADLQINDFFKKMMEALSALEEDGDKKKKKKKSAEEKEQEKLMQNFKMEFSILGDAKFEKDNFWPTNYNLSFTINMNIPEEGEINVTVLETITFNK